MCTQLHIFVYWLDYYILQGGKNPNLSPNNQIATRTQPVQSSKMWSWQESVVHLLSMEVWPLPPPRLAWSLIEAGGQIPTDRVENNDRPSLQVIYLGFISAYP